MNITSQSKYALRAVIYLAQTKKGVARREDIASAQGGISMEYLEKILLRLRERSILTAKSGPGGGYRLARPAEEMTAWDVIRAVEDSLLPVSCLDETRGRCAENLACEARPFWKRVWEAAADVMKDTTMASLAAEKPPSENSGDLPESTPSVQCK